MARCEDFPCCGHEPGCCPDYDESGRQLNMKCVCGATLPLHSRYSICETCLDRHDPDDPDYDPSDYDDGPDDLTEHEDFAHDGHLEDFGDWGYDGVHED